MDKEELEKQMNETAERFERSFEAWRKKRTTAVNVLDGCRTYLRHNLKIENIDLNVEEREPF